MIQNYCYIGKNKIHAELYDELLDDELSMYNQEHTYKIKDWIKKKILTSKYINLSDTFSSTDDIISDLIIKITTEANSTDLQGNSLLVYADSNEMYELFYMENLVKTFDDEELNEFGSVTNIHMQPVYWGCGIFKTIYDKGELKGSIIKKEDLVNLYIYNHYHMGVMIGLDGQMTEIEFVGDEPYRTIGNGFVKSNIHNILGFNFLFYVEKDSNLTNNVVKNLCGNDVNGRVYITLLCPSTQKKIWNITSKTLKDILKILASDELTNKFETLMNTGDNIGKDINSFYLVNKTLTQ